MFTILQINGNDAGSGSRQYDFCTTERAIFDSSEFEVGEKLIRLQLMVEISREEKNFGNFWRNRYISDTGNFIFEKGNKRISEIFSRGASWETFLCFLVKEAAD